MSWLDIYDGSVYDPSSPSLAGQNQLFPMMTFTQAAKAYTADTQTADVLERNTGHKKATPTWLKYSDKSEIEKYFWDV